MYLFEFLDTVNSSEDKAIDSSYSLSNGNKLRYLGDNKYDLKVKWFLVDSDGFNEIKNQVFIKNSTIDDIKYQLEAMAMRVKGITFVDDYKLFMFEDKRGASRFKIFICMLGNKVIDLVVFETMTGLLALKVRKLGRGITVESKFRHKIYVDLIEQGEFTKN